MIRWVDHMGVTCQFRSHGCHMTVLSDVDRMSCMNIHISSKSHGCHMVVI